MSANDDKTALNVEEEPRSPTSPMSIGHSVVKKMSVKIPHWKGRHWKQALIDGYSTKSHCTLETGTGCPVVIDYKLKPLVTFRVFSSTAGSILGEPVLWLEQVILTLMFVIFAMPTTLHFETEVMHDRHGNPVSMRKWLLDQEQNMRSFALIMSGLCVFLLTFYTSMAVTRWWTIRCKGVGAIKAAATELEMCIYQFVTKEEHVLDAIRRYAQASLLLAFLWRSGELHDMEQVLVGRSILTTEEVGQLKKWNHNLHETIWAWITAIVTTLYKQGKIPSVHLFMHLMDRCRFGMNGMQVIHTYSEVKVPFQYVHLLGLLVKLHNTVLAMIMGLLFGAALNEIRIIVCFQLFGRAILLPFCFNAILCINAGLLDPFDGGMGSFPRDAYVGALGKDINVLVAASKGKPPWILEREARLEDSPDREKKADENDIETDLGRFSGKASSSKAHERATTL